MCMRPSMVGKALFAIGLLLPGAALGVQEAYLKGTNTGEFDFFGSSVAVDGDVAVVGAPNHGNDPDEEIDGAGAAYIFRRAGGVWSQQRFLVEPSVEINHRYGGAVAVSSSAVAVASPSHLTRGAVFVYSLEGEAEAVLMASDGETDDNFGVDIDLSGNTLLVGTSAANAGYVFVREDASWSQQAVLTPPTGGSLQGSVALSGDRAALGAQSVAFSSEVLVFARSGGVWSLQATIEGGGFDVDIDGNTLAVSDGNTTQIHVFSDGAWTLQATLPHGRNLSLSGDAIAVAGWDEAVHVFVRSAGTWEQRDSLVGSNTDELDDYASSLAMSGELVIVGASHEDSDGTGVNGSQVQVSNSYNAGAAYAFRVDVPLTPSAGGTLRDVNRFGLPGEGLAGATLTLFLGSETLGTATSAADGSFEFEGLQSPDNLHNLRIQLGDVVRVYPLIRPTELDALTLTLPVDVRNRLNTELAKLENTPPLFRAYDTAKARDLLSQWNSTQPQTPEEHAARDQALGRLLIASEALAQLFASANPLAQDTGKLTVNTYTSVLALRKTTAEMAALTGTLLEGAADQLGERVALLVANATFRWLSLAVAAFSKAATDGVKSTLPPWGVELFEDTLAIVSKTALQTMSSGAWDSGVGRKALLLSVIETAQQEAIGRVLGSAYVVQTQQDLDLAEVRARGKQGQGSGVDAFVATQTRVNELALHVEDVLSLSSAFGQTASGWSAVADISLLVGRVPAAQIAAALGGVVKGMSVGALLVVTGRDYIVLHDLAFEDAPAAAQLAFFPMAGKGHPGRGMLRPVPPHASKGLPDGLALALQALRTALTDNDQAGVLAAAESLIEAEDSMQEAIERRQARLQALATSGDDALVMEDWLEALARSSVFDAERAVLFAQIAGFFLPALGDPQSGPADILAQIDAVVAAGDLFEGSMVAVETAVSGVPVPAFLVVERHGVGEDFAALSFPPGPFALRARVRNVGDAPITDARLSLEMDQDDDATLQLTLIDAADQVLGPLPAGAVREVVWQATAQLPPGQSVSESFAYRIQPLLEGGQGQNAVGGLFVEAPDGPDIFSNGFETRPQP